MAQNYSFGEARSVLSKHKKLLKKYEAVSAYVSELEQSIKSTADKMQLEAAMSVFKNIPVEELNRDKKGIRTQLLRDAGYETIGDLFGVSASQLQQIKGIGPNTATLIRDRVREYSRKTNTNRTAVRINVDEKNASTTKLVKAISEYLKVIENYSIFHQAYKEKIPEVSSLLDDLRSNTGFFRRIFATKNRKKKAEAAYSILSSMITGNDASYHAGIELISSNMYEAKHISNEVAWKEFKNNPIPFYNILERIAPNIFASDDPDYGLPEDLAREVRDEAFFPDGLKCTLRNYQILGVKYILHQGHVLLGDEMGLGKTVQAIASMVSLKNTGAKHFMVICPAAVLINWHREIIEHSKLQVIEVYGAAKAKALQIWLDSGGVAITTYETATSIRLPYTFRMTELVIDEAHYVKNPSANRSQAVRALCRYADRVLFMTGTPLENQVDEMISLIEVLQPRIAYSLKDKTYLSAAPEFRRLIAPVYYRRKRNEVLKELPDLIEKEEWCTLGTEENKVYEKAVLSKNLAASRRVSWNIEDLSKSTKAQHLLEILDEVALNQGKALIFSFYLDTIKAVEQVVGNRCYGPITGAMSSEGRQETIDRFKNAPAGSALVAQIQAGGTGLNIQAANVVIICEPQVKPSIETQAISRAYRMGQSRNVIVYRLLCANSIDERMMNRLKAKQKIFDEFADKSVAAENEVSIDGKTMNEIIQEEIDRINKSRKE